MYNIIQIMNVHVHVFNNHVDITCILRAFSLPYVQIDLMNDKEKDRRGCIHRCTACIIVSVLLL